MQGSELNKVTLGLEYFDSEASRDIYCRLLLDWSERFTRGQRKYRDVKHLGAKGVFPDVNRKTARLQSDIWEERTPPPGAEPTREVILDEIGHLFLMLHLWDNEPLHGLDERYSAKGLITDEQAKQQAHFLVHRAVHPEQEKIRQYEYPSHSDGPIPPPLADFKMEEDGTVTPLSDRARGMSGEAGTWLSDHSRCPNPHAHGDGWEDLPEGAREVLRRVAACDRIADRDRDAVKDLVARHEA